MTVISAFSSSFHGAIERSAQRPDHRRIPPPLYSSAHPTAPPTPPKRRAGKKRVDEWLVQAGLAETRSKAQGLVMLDRVFINDTRVGKAGELLREEDVRWLRVAGGPKYVSRGGEKLEGFMDAWGISRLDGKRVLDVGASTGGFSDCCLQRGAAHVTCVDVGRAQLDPKITSDPRVVNLERMNAKYLNSSMLPHDDYDVIVMDLSFISLTKVLPAVWPLLKTAVDNNVDPPLSGLLIALIKPQFECRKEEARRYRGIIRDGAIHRRVCEEITSFCARELSGSELMGLVESPIKGGEGNREYLLGLRRNPD
ncbi:unnamed protein product [Vitrella brassicaformis CCMP3155]|uniref:RNA-binding S4 domain-containing protein n=2 Tax=Vitrella brassicaformis TaxID=1169539 RepID=A0A0G4G0K4_VITBC|nr:unnamed protein product [Vitrella brassicaformis CCMP3155]|eukprot:CEM21063.1 unnamed protein product [Vitrella brassicaformis CCMP3155]